MILHPILLLSFATVSSAIKGVNPRKISLFDPIPGSSPSRWKCLNSSQEILLSAINDNYCDCLDGTDEPGTNACPDAFFHCVNEGHIGVSIRSSRVNDGLCEPECCDGSDEAPGVCPDVCGVVGAEHRRQVEAERKLRKTGSKIRSSYISFAQKEKKRLEQSIISLRQDVETKRAEETRLREIWEHTASLDAAMLELRKQSPTFKLLSDHSLLVEHLVSKEEKLKDRVLQLETILENLRAGYNPNYQDMAVLEAVRGWDALNPSSDEEAEDESDNDDSEAIEDSWPDERINDLKNTDALSALLEHERHIGRGTTDDFSAILFSVQDYLPDAFLPVYGYIRDTIIDALVKFGFINAGSSRTGGGDSEAKKHAHQAAENALKSAESNLASEEAALDRLFDPVNGFGKSGEWKKLDGACIEKDTGEYTYSVCFFGEAHQRSNRGGGSNSLGRFKSWDQTSSTSPGQLEYYSHQSYRNGARCWNGPERSVKLDLTCGTENALLTVAEPEKCEYHFTGTTPALCWTDAELGLEVEDATIKEEL